LSVNLVELQDLSGARQAYQRSLAIEPQNKVALEELSYVGQLESKKKKH
jgi:hypothetical protein